MPSTAQEALISELLGDVGKLHDQIKALPEALEGALKPTVTTIVQSSSTIRTRLDEAALERYEVIEEYVRHQKDEQEKFRERIRHDLIDASTQLRHQKISDTATKKPIVYSALACILSVVLVGVLTYFSNSHDQSTQVGNAVMAIWDTLDDKTQHKIKEQVAKQHSK